MFRRFVVLFILFVVGISLRLYRISAESISLEEYACIANLNVDNIINFILKQRQTYPYGGILFPLLQYGWGRAFGTDIVMLRLFSILMWSLFYVVLVYSLMRLERDRKLPEDTTLFVAVGITFSPALIFLGQEARMYMAYIFLVWCSLILFYQILVQPRVGMYSFLLFFVNQCLLWVHHVGILIWCAQAFIGAFYYLRSLAHRKGLKRLVIAHSVATIPWIIWLITIPEQPEELYRYYIRPGFKELMLFPLIGNIVGEGGICPTGVKDPWSFLPGFLHQFLREIQILMKWILIGLASISILRVVYDVIKKLSKRTYEFLFFTEFIGVTLLISIVLLFVIATIGPPIFTTRYISFVLPLHFLGLPLLLKFFSKSVRYIALGLITIPLIYQHGFMIPGPWRMDWKGVGNVIQEQSSEHDLVLIRDPFWLPIFKINNDDLPLPVSSAFTYKGLTELTQTYLSTGIKQSHNCNVWIIVPDVYGEGQPSLKPELVKADCEVKVFGFPGEQSIWLYKISKDSPSPSFYNSFYLLHYVPLERYIEEKGTQRIIKFVQKYFYEHDKTEFHFIRCACEVMKVRRIKEGVDLLYKAWDLNPNQLVRCLEWLPLNSFEPALSKDDQLATWGHLFLQGLICFYEKDYEGALNYFLQVETFIPEEPLISWFIASSYDERGLEDIGNFYWDKLFRLRPILPIGWHFIYTPAVLTLDKTRLHRDLTRVHLLDIVVDHISYVWERGL